jgi:hypothetical protein
VILAVLFWILFSLMLLIIIPDRGHARREIAKHSRNTRRYRYAHRSVCLDLEKRHSATKQTRV